LDSSRFLAGYHRQAEGLQFYIILPDQPVLLVDYIIRNAAHEGQVGTNR
jgi:hypothetical protein